MTQLCVKRLNVEREGRPVLLGLDLNLPRGTFLAIEGRSGVGKTSLLSCLAGMLECWNPLRATFPIVDHKAMNIRHDNFADTSGVFFNIWPSRRMPA